MFRDLIEPTSISSSEPKNKHFTKGMYNCLLSFLYSQSIGYEEAFIMDPYFCIR